MIFFLDENFPKAGGELLASRGYTVLDIRGSENEGADDDSVFKMAQEQSAIFLTTDKDFFHTIPYKYSSHHGVIVFNLRQPNRFNIVDKLKWVLENIDISDFRNKVLLLHDLKYIISK